MHYCLFHLWSHLSSMLYNLIDSSGDAMFMSCLDLLQASTFSFSAIKKGPAAERHDNTVINLPPISFKLQVISCVLFQSKVYVTGTFPEGEVLSRRVQVYSLEEVKWSALPQAPIYNAPATIINGCFTLIGGRQTKDGAITSILCSWIEEEYICVGGGQNIPHAYSTIGEWSLQPWQPPIGDRWDSGQRRE